MVIFRPMFTKRRIDRMNKKSQPEKTQDVSFEDSLKKLEKIVEELETGELSLDEALKLYEEGMQFSDHCLEKLNESKQKVEKLIKDSEKKFHTEPFSELNNTRDNQQESDEN